MLNQKLKTTLTLLAALSIGSLSSAQAADGTRLLERYRKLEAEQYALVQAGNALKGRLSEATETAADRKFIQSLKDGSLSSLITAEELRAIGRNSRLSVYFRNYVRLIADLQYKAEVAATEIGKARNEIAKKHDELVPAAYVDSKLATLYWKELSLADQKTVAKGDHKKVKKIEEDAAQDTQERANRALAELDADLRKLMFLNNVSGNGEKATREVLTGLAALRGEPEKTPVPRAFAGTSALAALAHPEYAQAREEKPAPQPKPKKVSKAKKKKCESPSQAQILDLLGRYRWEYSDVVGFLDKTNSSQAPMLRERRQTFQDCYDFSKEPSDDGQLSLFDQCQQRQNEYRAFAGLMDPKADKAAADCLTAQYMILYKSVEKNYCTPEVQALVEGGGLNTHVMQISIMRNDEEGQFLKANNGELPETLTTLAPNIKYLRKPQAAYDVVTIGSNPERKGRPVLLQGFSLDLKAVADNEPLEKFCHTENTDFRALAKSYLAKVKSEGLQQKSSPLAATEDSRSSSAAK